MRFYHPTDVAQQFTFVRELPGNKGQRVEAIQHWGGGEPGQSWCCYFATMVLDICYGGEAPIKRTGSCDVVLEAAQANGWIVTTPERDDIYLRVRNGNDAHHIGFVVHVDDGLFTQISGNTSSDGLSSNGDGVYERVIPITPDIVFVRVPE